MTSRHARPSRLLLALALAACAPSAPTEETFGTVTITAPEGGTSTSNVFVALRGSISPLDERIHVAWENAQRGESGVAAVTVSYSPVYPLGCVVSPFPCDPVGSAVSDVRWSADVPLSPGSNQLRVTARDEEGRVARAQVEVTQVPAPAIVRFGRPDDGSDGWTARSCREGVSVSATGAVALRVRNEATEEEWTSGPATYLPLYARLAAGPNRFVATATGLVGEPAEDAIVVTLELAPSIGLLHPSIGIDETSSSVYPLEVFVEDCGTPASISAENRTSGATTTVEGAGAVTLDVALVSGRNDVRVTVDLLGGRAVRDVTLYGGAAPPDWCVGTAWGLFQYCPSLALLNGP